MDLRFGLVMMLIGVVMILFRGRYERRMRTLMLRRGMRLPSSVTASAGKTYARLGAFLIVVGLVVAAGSQLGWSGSWAGPLVGWLFVSFLIFIAALSIHTRLPRTELRPGRRWKITRFTLLISSAALGAIVVAMLLLT